MVKQVAAWQASDGSLHLSRQDAADQDLRIALGVLNVFTAPTIEAIVQQRLTLVKLLNESLTPDARDEVEQRDA